MSNKKTPQMVFFLYTIHTGGMKGLLRMGAFASYQPATDERGLSLQRQINLLQRPDAAVFVQINPAASDRAERAVAGILQFER